MPDLDRSPIDQDWIRKYCDEMLKVTLTMPAGSFRARVLGRIDNVFDMVEAWQKRNWSLVERDADRAAQLAKVAGPK